MVHVVRTFSVTTPPDEALAYLADFGNAEQWDPGTDACSRLDDGPVAVGARWQNTSTVLGRQTKLEYRLEKLDGEGLVLVGENKSATATDVITVRPAGAGSEITYDATVELHGIMKVGSPIMQVEFERLGNGTVEGIQAALGEA